MLLVVEKVEAVCGETQVGESVNNTTDCVVGGSTRMNDLTMANNYPVVNIYIYVCACVNRRNGEFI